MKAVVITADKSVGPGAEYSVIEYKGISDIEKLVDGYVEVVRPVLLRDPFVMCINDSGRLLDLPINHYGSLLYGFLGHGCPIVGTIVFVKEELIHGSRDLVGLDDEDLAQLKHILNISFGFTEKE